MKPTTSDLNEVSVKKVPHSNKSGFAAVSRLTEPIQFTCRGRHFMGAIIAALCISVSAAASTTIFYGPTPYLSRADSPFDLSNLGTLFFLEDFEDGLLNTPGLSASNGFVRGPSLLTDSVDGDDGAIDGSSNGHSFLVRPGSLGVTFFFDPAVFGQYPTHVGIVSTDGYGQNGAPSNTVEFYGPNGEFLGSLDDLVQNFDVDTTDDDRFLGIYHSEGVSRIHVFNLGTGNSGLEVDHIQYGMGVVPEPGSLLLLGLGCAGLLGRHRRRLAH